MSKEFVWRELEVDGGSKVKLAFSLPVEMEAGEYFCIYSINLPQCHIERKAFGFDPVQALLLAMKMASAEIYSSKLYRDGKVKWLGMSDLGLPIAEVFKG